MWEKQRTNTLLPQSQAELEALAVNPPAAGWGLFPLASAYVGAQQKKANMASTNKSLA